MFLIGRSYNYEKTYYTFTNTFVFNIKIKIDIDKVKEEVQ